MPLDTGKSTTQSINARSRHRPFGLSAASYTPPCDEHVPERVEQLKRSVTAYIYAAAAACHGSSLKRCNAGVLGFEGCNTSRLRADFTERARTVRRGGLGILLAGVAEYDLSQKAPDRPASSHERLSAIEQPRGRQRSLQPLFSRVARQASLRAIAARVQFLARVTILRNATPECFRRQVDGRGF